MDSEVLLAFDGLLVRRPEEGAVCLKGATVSSRGHMHLYLHTSTQKHTHMHVQIYILGKYQLLLWVTDLLIFKER